MDVLHISEAYGGGVQSAISRYIENSPSLVHQILVRTRSEHDIAEPCGAESISYNGSMAGFVRAARTHILRTKPKAIHLHSSFAGLLRLFDFGPDTKVIYTPHAYAFLRRDSSGAARSAYRAVEVLLSKRAQTIAAISPFEAASAARMAGPSTEVTYLPNVVPDTSFPGALVHETSGRPEVVMAGRISAQKDPLFFAEAARASHSDVKWTWVGDGDADMREVLEQAGVSITGWVPSELVKKHIAAADLYLHSAEWEGAPITLLEAAAVGTPILARGIAALEGLGFPLTRNCPRAAAAAVDRFFSDRAYRVRAQEQTSESVAVHSPEVQSLALDTLYRRAG
ncbi:glycosyltransferase [Rhodococcoides kyotonense]|uniref:glycosyltransferase n=1 Tax=Rhodococcoides kyotonense TaxID=398843 RepID=UPI001FEA5221|nr:glycosyltransferase [Rhodococcus kyotonensis]